MWNVKRIIWRQTDMVLFYTLHSIDEVMREKAKNTFSPETIFHRSNIQGPLPIHPPLLYTIPSGQWTRNYGRPSYLGKSPQSQGKGQKPSQEQRGEGVEWVTNLYLPTPPPQWGDA